MAFLADKFEKIQQQLAPYNAQLIAVSKTKPVEDLQEAYQHGIRDFGENYVQELTAKEIALPKDIRWHFIGHLQTNKVKYIAPFVHLIHGTDSLKLLTEINKQGKKYQRRIHCLLQVYISKDETKFGFDAKELDDLINHELLNNAAAWSHVKVVGLMGMATFTEDNDLIRREFNYLKSLYDQYSSIKNECICFDTLSMGMSADYQFALEAGSNMVRIGSLLFGERSYTVN